LGGLYRPASLRCFVCVCDLNYQAMSAELFPFESEWKKRIERSPEAKQARQNLEFHRRKIRQMHEELTHAEAWEKELDARLQVVKEKVKPRILVFSEQLELSKGVEDKIVEATIIEEDSENLISVLRKKAIAMENMDRSQLLGFIKTVLNVRNCFLDKDNQHGVEVMQEMASGALKHLGRVTIDWMEIVAWEADMLRQLVREVEGVPAFMVMMMDQLLVKLVSSNSSSSVTQMTQSTSLATSHALNNNNSMISNK